MPLVDLFDRILIRPVADATSTMTSLPPSQALASLASLRAALQSIGAQPIRARAAPYISRHASSSMHTTASLYRPSTQLDSASAASSSSTTLPSSSASFASSSDTSTEQQDVLHASDFDFQGETYEIPPFDEGDLVAVPNKPPIVHVKLSQLRKRSSPSAGASTGKAYVPIPPLHTSLTHQLVAT